MQTFLKKSALTAAMAAALAPAAAPAFAQVELPPASPVAAPQVHDVALAEGGTLRGVFVDAQGAPLAGSPVRVLFEDRVVAETNTDAEGRFQVAGLRGGLHQVETKQGTELYRLWAPDTAPPNAARGVLLVNDGGVVRGQIVSATAGTALVAGGLIGGAVYWIVESNDSGS